MNVKEFVQSYQGDSPNNPIYAAFNLITFAKAIPWHIGKALILALLLYGVLTFTMFKMGVGYIFLFLGFVFGLIWAIWVGVTAGIKFITSGLINNFTDLLAGTVEPVDKMYDQWKDTNQGDQSRASFFKDVATDVILPEFTKMMGFLPFKGSIEQYLKTFLDRVFDDKDKEGTTAPRLGIAEQEETQNYASKVIDSIEEGTEHIEAKISAPFWKALKYGILFWGGMILLQYLIGIL